MANTHSTDLEASSSQYWSRADASIWDISTSTDRTMEAWVRVEGGAANRAIMGKWSASAKNWLLRMESGGEPKFFVGNGGSSTGGSIAGTTDISDGNWYHIALTYTASDDKARIYVNGKLEGTSAALSPGVSSEAFGIGCQDGSGGTSSADYWDGEIDDVRWWDSVRTADEILENMQVELNGDETNLQGYWKFNNNGNDETSNGYDLTNNNSATFNTDVAFDPQSTDLETSSSQYWSITDANQTGLDLTGDFTMEWWVKLERAVSTGEMFLVDKWTGSGNNRSYRIKLDYSGGDIMTVFLSNNGSTTNQGNISFLSDLSTETWYHIALTYDASAATIELFLDGVSQGTAGSMGTSVYNSTAVFELGGAASYFDGEIDEVRIWDDIRTDAEIDDNKCSTITGTEANLVAYWRFDGQGVDQSGNGNYLTNNNSATFSTDIFTDASVCSVVASTENPLLWCNF